MGVKTQPDFDRIMSHLSGVGGDGCWTWTCAPDIGGYGVTFIGSVTDGTWHRVRVHRYMYEHFVGEIPAGLDIDHLCRNRACANPAHLEPVTRRENVRRGAAGRWKRTPKTHCPQGHSYEGARRDSNGYPKCRRCDADRQQAIRSRRKAA